MKAFRVFLFCWIVAQTFYFGSYGPDLLFLKQIRPHNVLFVLTALSFLLAWFGGKTVRSPMEWPEKLLLLLGSICVLSFVLSGAAHDETVSKNKWLVALLNITLFPFATYFFVRALPYQKQFVVSVLKVICFLGIYLAFTGVFEHYGALHSLVWPGYIMDPSLGSHFERSRGPFMDSVAMGRVLTIVFTCWLVLRLESSPFLRKLSVACVAVTMASIYFTGTRGPWIGFALACLAFLIYKTPARKTVCCLMLLIVLASAFGLAGKVGFGESNLFLRREDTVTDRIVTWLVSDRMIKANPLFGIGFGRFNVEWPNYYKDFQGFDFGGFDGSHNTFLTMAAEVGIPAATLYLLMLFLMWRRCHRVYRRLDPSLKFERSFLVMVMGLVWMYIFTSWFSDLRWNTVQNTLIFLMFGIVAAMEKALRDNLLTAEKQRSPSDEDAFEGIPEGVYAFCKIIK